MARFVEMKRHGEKCLVNVETIDLVFVTKGQETRVCFIGGENDYINVDESYEEVKRLLMGEMNK